MSSSAIRGLWEIHLTRLPGRLGKVGEKELHLWVGAWLRDRARRALEPKYDGTRHLLFAICDHYEPLHGGVDFARGLARVETWSARYPEIARTFRDADGRPPRHSYFFPGEQYDGRFLEPLAQMCAKGMGEVEVHLHHDGDTRATLRVSLEKTLADLGRHGVISERGASPLGPSFTATGASPTRDVTADGAGLTTRWTFSGSSAAMSIPRSRAPRTNRSPES